MTTDDEPDRAWLRDLKRSDRGAYLMAISNRAPSIREQRLADCTEECHQPDGGCDECDELDGEQVDAGYSVDGGPWVGLDFPPSYPAGSDEWHAERLTCIGGSEAAACVSLAPASWGRCTPLDIYRAKLGEVDRSPPSMAMRRGTALEPVIMERYAELTGSELFPPIGLLRHPEHHFMGAHLDGLTTMLRMVEAKSCDFPHGWGEPGTDQIPLYYSIQVQHCLCILLAIHPDADPVADVPVWISGEQDIRIYHVEADPDIHAMLTEAEGHLWDCIQRERLPAPSSGLEVTKLVEQSSDGLEVVATPAALADWERLQQIDSLLGPLKREREPLVDRMQTLMIDAEVLVDDAGRELATWKTSKPSSTIDMGALKAGHAELVEQYMTQRKPGRPFLVKAGKKVRKR